MSAGWAAAFAWLALSLSAPAAPAAEEPGAPDDPASEVRETVVVTAARVEEPAEEAVGMVTVLEREELVERADLAMDEALRQVPGFSLFRRSSSLDSHPTTQGVSLRGIGPSGAGRTLVLFDGIPWNDPFGGWVYWSRLPRLSLERVEVARGGGSALWGSSALGGVIQLLPRRPGGGVREGVLRMGERDTYGAEVFASGASSGEGAPWAWSVAGSWLDAPGHFLLRPEDRGTVDRRAGSTVGALFGRLHRGRYHAGVQLYRDRRRNGTALQENDTEIALLEAGFRGDAWSWTLHGQTQELESTFSRVAPDRSEEVLTARQRFASRGMGASTTWEPGSGWLVGGDWRRAAWSGREQDLAGVFVQKDLAPSDRLRVLATGRVDLWENRGTQWSFNPRLGAVYRATSTVMVRSSVYRSFRAPTLNELYRPFRVGNVRTLANPELDAERLWGAEVGIDWAPGPERPVRLVRLNAFRNELDRPVGNVTLEVTPDGILRQRRNLGRVTVEGLEAEATAGVGPASLRLAYLYSRSEVAETGLRLPQAPEHSATAALSWRGPVPGSLQARWLGRQFEDDRNELPLEPALVVDLRLDRRLSRSATLFVAAENLLDEEVVTGRLPEERLGAPRTLHLGLSFGAR